MASTAQSIADILSHCPVDGARVELKRVDKDRNVIGDSSAQEFGVEVERCQRMKIMAGEVQGKSRADKMDWALQLKDHANSLYHDQKFKDAAKVYTDCLVALDFGETEEEARETQLKLQLPVTTNLAACMIEQGSYSRCIELCNIALGIDPCCIRALYRRGVAHYRRQEHDESRRDFEAALAAMVQAPSENEQTANDDMMRRMTVYLSYIRRKREEHKLMFARAFTASHYVDKPDWTEPPELPPLPSDSDDDLEPPARGFFSCCKRRSRHAKRS